MQFDYEKATQALNYLAKLDGGKINKMKALKLVWLTERLHLRKFGRLILNDEYLAMEYGPVASSTKDIAQLNEGFLSKNEYEYASQYIMTDDVRLSITSIKEPDTDVFSDSEIEVFSIIYKTFGNISKYKLAEFSHLYPEWEKHKLLLETGNISRKDMDYDDFFEDPKAITNDFFADDSERIQNSKEIFHDIQTIDKALN